MEIYNLKDRPEFIREIAILEHNEWGEPDSSIDEFENNIDKKICSLKSKMESSNFCKLILVNENELIGFISIFPTDGDERTDLTPWYATMYVKEKYRGNGYSKILNNAIIREAKARGYKKLYLKSDLVNYYEKFGAIYMEDLKCGEKLYYINIDE